MKSNIMLLSAGRRVELAKIILQTLTKEGFFGELYCADMSPDFSAACQVIGKYVKLPHTDSKEYLENLLTIVDENSIGILIPTIDTEIDFLKDHIDKFSMMGCNLVLSDKEFIEKCRDKRLTASILNQYDINFTELYDREALEFPCYAKPYNGSRSINNYLLRSRNDLTSNIIDDESLIFTKLYSKPYQEFTIDAYYDKYSELKCAVPRRRLEVRSGEVSKAITIKNEIYNVVKNKLNRLTGARGPINIQLFFHPEEKIITVFEINPRFAGGYPLTYESGLNYIEMLLKEYLYGESLEFNESWGSGNLMLRYDAHCIVKYE